MLIAPAYSSIATGQAHAALALVMTRFEVNEADRPFPQPSGGPARARLQCGSGLFHGPSHSSSVKSGVGERCIRGAIVRHDKNLQGLSKFFTGVP
jgi:hypothetical protein